jgi:hypothetical protein
MSARTGSALALVFGIACLVFNILAAVQHSLLLVAVAGSMFVALIVGFLVALIGGFVSWRRKYRYWMLPAGLCLLFACSPWIARPMGRLYGDWEFKSDLPLYQAAVNEIEKRELPSRPARVEIGLDQIKSPPWGHSGGSFSNSRSRWH